ncbi:MAG: tRNA uridine-5-carboxymethylaminomethyl(34) synthesis enzyme MnmG [Candidatus Omnitrophica bacterium]|nr:tRNA uridine-5-carboxymethylaminomethyl(34) synthesis enzyme MnmG [Candidatus Omnitrophota bacterium]
MKRWDVIVVGAGHAGIEAANASSKLGCSVLFLTLNIDTIGKLSCNPAVGGIAKSHLVREVDILGGLIAKLTDKTSLQYRILNKSKGKAVRATRVQVDRFAYQAQAKDFILDNKNIEVLEAEVKSLLVKKKRIEGVLTNAGLFRAKTVVICPGTFLNGLVHIGLKNFPSGRLGEPASRKLYDSLVSLGFTLKHFKTGTCARLDRRSLDFSKMTPQEPDKEAWPFSFFTSFRPFNKERCFITHTNPKTHRIIRKNLKYSPLYQGVIKAKGVRYCPSLEDKVVKFSRKERHQIFIEPEGRDSIEVYPNGISTSLPLEVQYEFIHSIEGLGNARIFRPGYGIEHAVIEAKDLFFSLESKKIKGLFFAGQINGTTGYEEAAAQGLVAGINAGLKVKKKEAFIPARDESFTGLLIDDLVSKGTDEPYRMFTSRSELRLSLREDNAPFRLFKDSYKLGLISRRDFSIIEEKLHRIKNEIDRIKKVKIYPSKQTNKVLRSLGEADLAKVDSGFNILKRPKLTYPDLAKLGCGLGLKDRSEVDQVEIEVKYEGFIKRETQQARELKKLARIKIPKGIDYSKLSGLSREIVEKFKYFKPKTLKEASNIPGVTPAAVLILLAYLKKK